MSLNSAITVLNFYRDDCFNQNFLVPSADSVSKSGCQHLTKAVDATSVRKGIVRAGGFASLKCANCKKLPLNNTEEKVIFSFSLR